MLGNIDEMDNQKDRSWSTEGADAHRHNPDGLDGDRNQYFATRMLQKIVWLMDKRSTVQGCFRHEAF